MSLSDGMRMVFRLDGIGFTLPVEALIEVREGSRGWIDSDSADPQRHLLGTLLHRGEPIAVHDPRPGLGLSSAPLPEQVVILIVAGQERPVALPVDGLEGIYPAAEFVPHELPSLLHRPDQGYDTLEVWRGEPLVRGELERLVPSREAG